MTIMLWIWEADAPEVGRAWGRAFNRAIELEDWRRSIVTLPPGSHALDREHAVALIAELQESERRLRGLRDALRELLDEG
jgi:hypothetical protein